MRLALVERERHPARAGGRDGEPAVDVLHGGVLRGDVRGQAAHHLDNGDAREAPAQVRGLEVKGFVVEREAGEGQRHVSHRGSVERKPVDLVRSQILSRPAANESHTVRAILHPVDPQGVRLGDRQGQDVSGDKIHHRKREEVGASLCHNTKSAVHTSPEGEVRGGQGPGVVTRPCHDLPHGDSIEHHLRCKQQGSDHVHACSDAQHHDKSADQDGQG